MSVLHGTLVTVPCTRSFTLLKVLLYYNCATFAYACLRLRAAPLVALLGALTSLSSTGATWGSSSTLALAALGAGATTEEAAGLPLVACGAIQL